MELSFFRFLITPFRKSSFSNEWYKSKGENFNIKDKVEEMKVKEKHSRIMCDPTFVFVVVFIQGGVRNYVFLWIKVKI